MVVSGGAEEDSSRGRQRPSPPSSLERGIAGGLDEEMGLLTLTL